MKLETKDAAFVKRMVGSWWFESLQTLQSSPRPDGEFTKPQCCCQKVARATIILSATAMVTLGFLAWMQQPFYLRSFPLPWEKNPVEVPSSAPMIPPTTSDPLKDFLEQRGVGLLHTWTDAQLFKRAVALEKSLSTGKNLSERSSNSTVPKIAFLFLTQGDLPFATLWNKFFQGHEGFYNVYVHLWPLKLSRIRKNMGVFWGRVVPSDEGRRLTPGLIADGRRLLANALLDDVNNQWFAMISESCIPLHGFRHTYDAMAATRKTFMHLGDKHWDMWSRYVGRGDDVMKPEIEFWQFRVGSQFWVMRRRHAVMTVADTKYWDKFNLPCVPKHANCFPEEHYFATLLNILDPGGVTGYTSTLVDWSRMEPGGHPRKFRGSEINRGFLENLQKLDNGRFLFARKFDRNCLLPLLAVANSILEH